MATSARDVAALAGVSQRTVSNVVRGYVHVSPETRERVERAIAALNYRPNPSARSLRSGRTGIIGLAVPEIAAPYFAELADHVQRTAAAHGLTLLIDQTGAERDSELLVLQGYRGHVIDGLIFSPMALSGEDLAAHHPGVPTVLLGERISDAEHVTVAIDNVAAAREACTYLLANGRTRIVAIGADVTTNNMGPARARLRGYQHAHHDAGLTPPPGLAVPTGGWGRVQGHAAVTQLINDGIGFDGLFCFNDQLALGALRALHEKGRSVPGDVSVVGWDDIEEASFSVPALTTVSPDKTGIATAAVTALLARIAGDATPPQPIICDHRLLVRES